MTIKNILNLAVLLLCLNSHVFAVQDITVTFGSAQAGSGYQISSTDSVFNSLGSFTFCFVLGNKDSHNPIENHIIGNFENGNGYSLSLIDYEDRELSHRLVLRGGGDDETDKAFIDFDFRERFSKKLFVITYDNVSGLVKFFIRDFSMYEVLESPGFIKEEMVLPQQIKTSTSPFIVGVGEGVSSNYGDLCYLQMYQGVAENPKTWNGTKESLGGTLNEVMIALDGGGLFNKEDIHFDFLGSSHGYANGVKSMPFSVDLLVGQSEQFQMLVDSFNVTNVYVDNDNPPRYLTGTIDANNLLDYVWQNGDDQEPNSHIKVEHYLDEEYNLNNLAVSKIFINFIPDPPSFDTANPGRIARLETEYSYQFDVTDQLGSDITSYSLADNPAGMAIDNNGILTWTPTAEGIQTYEVVATDEQGEVSSKVFKILVRPGRVDLSYENSGSTFTPSTFGMLKGESQPFAILNPAGDPAVMATSQSDSDVELESSNEILVNWSGENGSVSIEMQGGVSRTLNITQIADAPSFDSDTNLGSFNLNESIQLNVKASDFVGSAMFYELLPIFPEGMNLSPEGELTWMPTEVGIYSFDIKATDAHGEEATETFFLLIDHEEDTVNQVNHFEFNELLIGQPVVDNNFKNSADGVFYGFSSGASLDGVEYGYNDRGGVTLEISDSSDLNAYLEGFDFLKLGLGRAFVLETSIKKGSLEQGALTLMELFNNDKSETALKWWVDAHGFMHVSLLGETLSVQSQDPVVSSDEWTSLQVVINLDETDSNEIVKFINIEGVELTQSTAVVSVGPVEDIIPVFDDITSKMFVRETQFALAIDYLRVVTDVTTYDSSEFYGGEFSVPESASTSVMIPGSDVFKRTNLRMIEIINLTNDNELAALRASGELYDRYPAVQDVFHGVFEINFALKAEDFAGSLFVDIYLQKPGVDEPFKKIAEVGTQVTPDSEDVIWIHKYWDSRRADFDWDSEDAEAYKTTEDLQLKLVVR